MNDITFKPLSRHGIITQEVDGETLILNNHGSEIHQLNEVASLIWKHCDGGHTIKDISELIQQHYSITNELAISDVITIVAQLKAKGLLA